MVWFGTGSDGGERVSVDLGFGSDESDFSLSGRYAGLSIEYEVSGEDWAATVDGDGSPDEETLARMRLDREDGVFWRSYYGFLAGLRLPRYREWYTNAGDRFLGSDEILSVTVR